MDEIDKKVVKEYKEFCKTWTNGMSEDEIFDTFGNSIMFHRRKLGIAVSDYVDAFIVEIKTNKRTQNILFIIWIAIFILAILAPPN